MTRLSIWAIRCCKCRETRMIYNMEALSYNSLEEKQMQSLPDKTEHLSSALLKEHWGLLTLLKVTITETVKPVIHRDKQTGVLLPADI